MQTQMRSDLFTNLGYIGFSIPATNCLPGSAWHLWQSHGAYFATNHPGECTKSAAHHFAAGPEFNHLETSNPYKARKRAFLEGASR